MFFSSFEGSFLPHMNHGLNVSFCDPHMPVMLLKHKTCKAHKVIINVLSQRNYQSNSTFDDGIKKRAFHSYRQSDLKKQALGTNPPIKVFYQLPFIFTALLHVA